MMMNWNGDDDELKWYMYYNVNGDDLDTHETCHITVLP